MSGLIQPNGAPAPSAEHKMPTATIGGTPDIEYQPDPTRGVQLPPHLVTDGSMLLHFLTGVLNMTHALIREVLEQRTRLEEYEDAVAKAPGVAQATTAADTKPVIG